MSYTIELSRSEEEIVERRAARLGITAQEYVRRTIGRQLQSRRLSELRLTADEQAMLDALNRRLPASFWQRYGELTAKIRDRTLSESEHTEIKRFAAQEEAWNVERLQLLQGMAQKRSVSLLRFMKYNHIGNHPEADRFASK
jgi:hypothetical protein